MPSINGFYGQVVAMNATLNAQLATLEGQLAELARLSAYEACGAVPSFAAERDRELPP